MEEIVYLAQSASVVSCGKDEWYGKCFPRGWDEKDHWWSRSKNLSIIARF